MEKENNADSLMEKIVNLSKRRGIIFQSADIYGGFRSTYDYGPIGSLLLRNVKDAWWKSMVQLNDNIVGIDSAIFSHPTTWKASGHVDAFNDPMIDNKDSKKRYRADNLIEDYIQKAIKYAYDPLIKSEFKEVIKKNKDRLYENMTGVQETYEWFKNNRIDSVSMRYISLMGYSEYSTMYSKFNLKRPK